MDYISSKVLVIAVGLLVVLAIMTGVIFVLSSINDVFDLVENTNTSIIAQYDNIYSMYSGSNLNTVGLLNTLRKYEEDDGIIVLANFKYSDELEEHGGKTAMIQNINSMIAAGSLGYETMYNVSVKEEGNLIYIMFNKK